MNPAGAEVAIIPDNITAGMLKKEINNTQQMLQRHAMNVQAAMFFARDLMPYNSPQYSARLEILEKGFNNATENIVVPLPTLPLNEDYVDASNRTVAHPHPSKQDNLQTPRAISTPMVREERYLKRLEIPVVSSAPPQAQPAALSRNRAT